MAFDPDAYLAAKAAPVAAPGGFDPDAYLASKGAAPAAAPGEEPGRLEALGRGALQGVTFGFGDEIQGALESIFTDKTYQRARDEARQANARAQQAHSGFYGGGEIAGGIAGAFVPGLDIAEGAGLGTVATKSALAGALGGVGTSEATDVGGLAQAAGAGALEGAAGGAIAHGVGKGLGKVLGGAEAKEETAALKGIAGAEGKAGASLGTTKKLMDSGAAREMLHEEVAPGETLLSHAHGTAEETKPAIQTLQEKVGREELDPLYAKHQEATGGVNMSDFVRHIDAEISDLKKSPINENHIEALEKTRDSALKAWAPELADALASKDASAATTREAILRAYDAKVPASDIRALATKLQRQGATNVANPAEAKQIKQALGGSVKDFVNGEVEKALGPADRAALEHSNARMSALYSMEKAVEEREPKEFGNRLNASGAGSKLLQGAGLIGGMALAPHTIPGAIAAAAAPKLLEQVPKVGRFATSQAAKANQVLTQVLDAAKQGVPWAQAQIRMLRQTPVGAARLAQIAAQTVSAPVDQQAQEAQ